MKGNKNKNTEANSFNFTDSRLLQLTSSDKKRRLVFDSRQPGLAMLITLKGSKSFKFKMWDPKRKKSVEITIGSYPKTSLSVAKERARELADDIARGIDIIEQQHSSRKIPTLDLAFERWINKKKAQGKSSYIYDEMRYDKYIRPEFGNKLVTDITKSSLEKWLYNLPVQASISPTTANRIIVVIKTIYNKEITSYENPCHGIELYKEHSRERFLKPEEIPSFFDALDHPETPNYLRYYVLISLYTGARKANILSMKWKDIDLDLGVWVIAAKESKNRTSLTIPLIKPAIELLFNIKKDNLSQKNPSDFVFPSTGTKKSKSGHLSDPRLSWKNLLERAKIDDFQIHDLRRSLGSWQTIMGSSTAIVGKSLGHKSQQATEVYSRLNLAPVRESMERAINAMKTSEYKEL